MRFRSAVADLQLWELDLLSKMYATNLHTGSRHTMSGSPIFINGSFTSSGFCEQKEFMRNKEAGGFILSFDLSEKKEAFYVTLKMYDF